MPAVQQGMTEEMVASLADLETADITDREKLAVQFAQRMATDHHSMGDDFFEELRPNSLTLRFSNLEWLQDSSSATVD